MTSTDARAMRPTTVGRVTEVVNMPEFHETRMGVRFFESQVPKLIDLLDRIARSTDANAQAMVKVASTIGDAPPDERCFVVWDITDPSGTVTVYATISALRVALREEIGCILAERLDRWSGDAPMTIGAWHITPTLLRCEP